MFISRSILTSILTLLALNLTPWTAAAAGAPASPGPGWDSPGPSFDIDNHRCGIFNAFDGQPPSEAIAEALAASEGETLLEWSRCECDAGGEVRGCIQLAVGDDQRFDNLVVLDDECSADEGCGNDFAGYTLAVREEYEQTLFDYDSSTVWVSYDIDYYAADEFNGLGGPLGGLLGGGLPGGLAGIDTHMAYTGFGTVEIEQDSSTAWISWAAYDATGVETDSDSYFLIADYDGSHESRCEQHAESFATTASVGVEAVGVVLGVAAMVVTDGGAIAVLDKLATITGLAGTAVGEWGAGVYELAFCFDEFGEIGEGGYWVNCGDGASSSCESQSGWYDFEVQNGTLCETGQVFVEYTYDENSCACVYRYLSVRDTSSYEGNCNGTGDAIGEAASETTTGD